MHIELKPALLTLPLFRPYPRQLLILLHITSKGQGTGTRAEIVMWLWTIVQIISVDPLLNYFVRLVLDVNWLNGLHQPPPARQEAATAAHLIGPLQPRSRAEAELLALLGKWHSRNGKCFELPPLTTNHFRRKWNFHSLNQNLMEPFMLKISQIILSK